MHVRLCTWCTHICRLSEKLEHLESLNCICPFIVYVWFLNVNTTFCSFYTCDWRWICECKQMRMYSNLHLFDGQIWHPQKLSRNFYLFDSTEPIWFPPNVLIVPSLHKKRKKQFDFPLQSRKWEMLSWGENLQSKPKCKKRKSGQSLSVSKEIQYVWKSFNQHKENTVINKTHITQLKKVLSLKHS